MDFHKHQAKENFLFFLLEVRESSSIFIQLNIGWTGLEASDRLCSLLLLLILKRDNFLPRGICAKKEDTIILRKITNFEKAI